MCACVSSARFDWLAARALWVCVDVGVARARFGWLAARVFLLACCGPPESDLKKMLTLLFFATAAKIVPFLESRTFVPPNSKRGWVRDRVRVHFGKG